MKIAKSKLAQIIQEELSNTMTEGFGLVGALSAVKDAEDKGIVDAQDDFADIRAGRPVKQTDTTEETQEEEIAYAKAYHDTMDRLKQNVADRKLYRPPEPEGEDHDVQHYDGEFFQEGTNKMKITKSKLSKIIQEEVAKSIKEGMMDAIKNKLSPKRPAKAPYQRSENDKKARHLMGVEDAEDAKHISGDYRESPSSDDEDYMAGWNSVMREGKNKIKITKSTLAQIVQEELTAMKAEGYGAYKRDDKNKKGLSPQYRGTDAASTDDTEERFHKSEHSPYSDKKPKRGMKEGGLDNDWGDLEEEEIYALEALMSLGGEQPAGDIAAVASEKYENANRSIDYSDPRNPDTGLGEEDFGDYIQTALDSLQAKGKVRLTQGEPGSGVEAFYALA